MWVLTGVSGALTLTPMQPRKVGNEVRAWPRYGIRRVHCSESVYC